MAIRSLATPATVGIYVTPFAQGTSTKSIMNRVASLVFASLISVLLSAIDCGQSSAQSDKGDLADSKSDKEQALIKRWFDVYEEIIDSIKFAHSTTSNDSTQSISSSELKRQTLVTLVSAVNDRHGNVHLWTDRGRPIIMGVIMSARDTMPNSRVIALKFNSMTQGSVVGSRNDEVFWKCDEPGVHWKGELSDLVPSNNRATRLTQMKAIVRQFSAEGSSANRTNNEYRLMPQPIYRYAENTPNVVDGAIFSLVLETDPKVFLQIEARENEWFLSCSRNAAFEAKVRKGDEVIWSFDTWSNVQIFQTKPFYMMYTSERRQADDPSKILFSRWGSR